MTRKRVLFIVEDITLAQVVRLVTLARSLPRDAYEVHFASARFDPLIFAGTDFVCHPIYTVPAEVAFKRLERGQRLYSRAVLERYVGEELSLFRRLKPHAVVGDLRFSLTVSAPHAGVPYAALINAYWHRAMQRDAFPLPEHPVVRLLGQQLAERYFWKAMPRVLAWFAAPVNALRKRHQLPELGDLIDVMMYGDRVLFPDVPALTPLRALAPHEVFLGPVLWSPDGPVPDWWSEPLPERSAYVTLGSSGRLDRLPIALAGLERLQLPLMLSTAGRLPERAHAQLRAASFLPGSEAARRARFVLSNGGSSTSYQALAEGRPVLGVASNLDQYLAMTAVKDAGAGILLRSDSLTACAVERAARELLEEERYHVAARKVASALRAYDSASRFERTLRDLAA